VERSDPVEQDLVHPGVIQKPRVRALEGVHHRLPLLVVEHVARGHRRAHQQCRPRVGRDGGGEPLQIEPPAAIRHHERHKRRARAGEPDPPDQPSVRRVCEHDLIAGIDGGQDCAQRGRRRATRDHDLVLGVVRAPALRLQTPSHDLTQWLQAREGKPAVRGVGPDGVTRRLDRYQRRRHVRVEVLHPQDIRCVAGSSGDLIDSKRLNVPKALCPTSRHRVHLT
jgi:hypothetical protein